MRCRIRTCVSLFDIVFEKKTVLKSVERGRIPVKSVNKAQPRPTRPHPMIRFKGSNTIDE